MKKTILICVVLIVLVSCASSENDISPLPTTSLPATPIPDRERESQDDLATVVVPDPEEGLAAVAGTLYTYSGHGPVPETLFYLTPVRGENGEELPAIFTEPTELDILGNSGPNGEVQLSNIPPGKYFFIVWAPYNWIVAVDAPGSATLRLIEVASGDQLQLGNIYVAWPQ